MSALSGSSADGSPPKSGKGAEVSQAEVLHVGRPNIGNRTVLAGRIERILDSRWLTNNGPLVQEFEAALSKITGARHCIAVCNATVGLEIAVRALGLRGEVIVPSFTFVATAHALQWQEITPVFCDIEPNFHLLDVNKVESMITPRTSGILGVHTWGRTADAEALGDIARRHGLELLFDAAHAFGCSRGSQMVGRLGRCEIFSFHATKFINAFEGGAIATDDDSLARQIRLMKNFGFAGYDAVDYVGTNGKMPEVCAAMGLTSLESMKSFVARNRKNYERYLVRLEGIPGVRILPYTTPDRFNYQYVVIEVDPRACGVERDSVLRSLNEENVLARRYFFPGCHNFEPYRSLFPHAGLLLPTTEEICRKVLVLPTGTAVGLAEVDRISEIISRTVGASRNKGE